MSETFSVPRPYVVENPAAHWRRPDQTFTVRIYSDLMRYVEERAVATKRSKGKVILDLLEGAIQREKALAGEEQVDA